MYQYKLSSTEIEIELEQVILSMGYSVESIPNGLEAMLKTLYPQFLKVISPECGFILPANNKTKFVGSGIVLGDIEFNTGKKIASRLKDIERSVLFLVTIGNGIDSWIQKLVDEDDIHSAYLVDVIASEYIEKLSEWTEAKIKSIVGNGFGYSNRYGPGYCDWDLAEQDKLFSFLPKDFCGVTLSESSMMKPRKSLSGIIGYGEKLKPLELPCNVCTDFMCHRNTASGNSNVSNIEENG